MSHLVFASLLCQILNIPRTWCEVQLVLHCDVVNENSASYSGLSRYLTLSGWNEKKGFLSQTANITLRMRALVLPSKSLFAFSHSEILISISQFNEPIQAFCTYLNVFLVMIPN